MKNLERRLSAIEHQTAKSMSVNVSYVGKVRNPWETEPLNMLQAVQGMMARKIYRIEIETAEQSVFRSIRSRQSDDARR